MWTFLGSGTFWLVLKIFKVFLRVIMNIVMIGSWLRLRLQDLVGSGVDLMVQVRVRSWILYYA